MAEYVAAKENIFRYQRPGDIAVFNQDNDITRQQAGRAVGTVRLFSRRSGAGRGRVPPGRISSAAITDRSAGS